MGLQTSHDCFSGSYSSFHALRTALADAARLPPLDIMEGYLTEQLCNDHQRLTRLVVEARNRGFPFHRLPYSWDDLPRDVLHVLLRASDSDGTIPHAACLPLSRRLMQLAQRVAELPVEEEPDEAASDEGGDEPGYESGYQPGGEAQVPSFPSYSSGSWERAMTTFAVARFAAGLKAAHDAGEDVQFW